MEWFMETVLPQQDWKSASAIEERDAALALIHDDLRDRDNQIQAIDTARKTIFPRSWNIIESSKRPRKYHLSINFLAEKKTVFPITEKFKTRTFQ